MENDVVKQRNALQLPDIKALCLSLAALVLKAALCQMLVGILVSLTGMQALLYLFYGYILWMLWQFFERIVGACEYVLEQDNLMLRHMLGDCIKAHVDIPLADVRAIRPVAAGEYLKLYIQRVQTLDRESKPSLRMRASIWLSLISARLARRLAAGKEQEMLGYAVVYEKGNRLQACVIRPDEQMLEALGKHKAFGGDERMLVAPLMGILARALQRAFPALYPHVQPLTDVKELEAARREIARRKAAGAKRKSGLKKGNPKKAGAEAKKQAEEQKSRRRRTTNTQE